MKIYYAFYNPTDAKTYKKSVTRARGNIEDFGKKHGVAVKLIQTSVRGVRNRHPEFFDRESGDLSPTVELEDFQFPGK